MKTLTLTQPWATLVAIKAKKIETRSWTTNYRGPLAIHAAKSFPIHARQTLLKREFWKMLEPAGYTNLRDFPLGCVIATYNLQYITKIAPYTELPTDPEWSFGDYTIGRYMWLLDGIQILPKPVPARGALNLWEWME